MEHELGSLKPKPGKDDYRPALQNPAVAHCHKTWERVYRAVLKENGSVAVARIEAAEAYRAAMPLLIGDENIRDFIGCVTFGITSAILIAESPTKLLYAAQVAFNVGRSRAKKPKNPPKTAPRSTGSRLLHKKNATPSPLRNAPLITNDLAKRPS